MREQNSFTKSSVSKRSLFLRSSMGWRVGGCCVCGYIHIQIRILFYFPIFFLHSLAISFAFCFIFCCLFVWFCNYFFWRPTLRMCKETISYALHKFHLVCNAHTQYFFFSVRVTEVYKMYKLRWTQLASC